MTTQKFSFSFSKHTVDAVLSDSTPLNFANFWQIKWNWIRQMKFEQCNFTFEVFYSVCCHPDILPPWQRDVTTSPLYLMVLLPCSQECVIQDTPILFSRKGLRIQWLVFKTFKPGFHWCISISISTSTCVSKWKLGQHKRKHKHKKNRQVKSSCSYACTVCRSFE